MSYYYEDDDATNHNAVSKLKIFIPLIIIAFVIVIIAAVSASTKRLDNKMDIVTSLPAGSPKIVLTQDLAKEHMVAYLENQRAMLPFTVALTVLICIIVVTMNFIPRRYSRARTSKNFNVIISTVAIFIIIFVMGYGMITTLINTSSPETQTPTIRIVSVINKDYETHRSGRHGHTRYYYLTYGDGSRDRVSESVYNKVDIGHSYYFGYTEQNTVFAVYDMNVYTLQQ